MTSQHKVQLVYPKAVAVREIGPNCNYCRILTAADGGEEIGEAPGDERRAWSVAARNVANIVKARDAERKMEEDR